MEPDCPKPAEEPAAPVPWLNQADTSNAPAATDAFLCWTVLIADDDEGVHAVTKLVLSGECICGRPLRFLDAYSAAEAKALLRQRPDIALVLLDVAMEAERAGLDVVDYARNELHNLYVRIILRTGQHGFIPPQEIVARYDINGYLDKAQLTASLLYCSAHTALSAFRDLTTLDATQRELCSALNEVGRREMRLRLLLNHSPIGLAEAALDCRFVGVNPSLCAMLGYTEAELLARSLLDIIHPDDLAADLANKELLLRGERATYSMEKRYVAKSGDTVHVQTDVALMRGEDAKPAGFIIQVQSIGERLAAQQRLQSLNQRLSLAVSAASLGVWAWDLRTSELSWDAAMHDIYGLAEGTPLRYEHWKRALLPEDSAMAEAQLARAVEQHGRSDSCYRIVHPERGVRYIESFEDVVTDAAGQVVSVVGVNRDVTRQRQIEDALLQRQAEIVRLSLTDALTGIANRRRLDEQLETDLNRVRRYGGKLSLALADLDHFKRVNDAYGHDVGDCVLKTFVEVMKRHVRDTDLIARLGGEEFVIVMPQSDCNAAEALAERIRAELARTRIAPLTQYVTVSFGIAELLPDDCAASLLRRTDQALYRAKTAGRNRTVIADHDDAGPPTRRLRVVRK
jgi:diguanylate cyclase (GGDEF)-like protein/PAS domain S-box-containing protein